MAEREDALPAPTRIRLHLLGIGGLAASALLLAACGGTGAAGPTPTPQRPPAAGQPLAPATKAAQPPATAKPGEKPAAGGTGDANRGKQLFVQKGCTACHVVPGIPEATGTIGPNLAGIAGKPKIPTATGELENTPDNMVKWIMNPTAVKPSTQMPPLGITEAEARDLTAFMFTLK